MEVEEKFDALCSVYPLLGCVWDFLVLLRSFQFDPIVNSGETPGKTEVDASTEDLVVAENHFRQVQHIRGP
uniref:Uncharacterized protein n=1 Tax=Nelumbo nucifera TaxID=4432 RepID=A0A822YLV5_NELNU|nr:TPA_asm: hypothetical protein HUJ06_011130 [Nelumbo nucifera]